MGRKLTRILILVASLTLVFGCAATPDADLASKSEMDSDLFRKSQNFYVHGDYERALETITLAIEREPGRAELWNGRGYILMKENQSCGV